MLAATCSGKFREHLKFHFVDSKVVFDHGDGMVWYN